MLSIIPGPHRVLVVMTPGPNGFGMNLELNEEGRAMVKSFRQLSTNQNPAQQAGAMSEDVLLECNGFLVDSFEVAVEALRSSGPGPVRLVMRRGDRSPQPPHNSAQTEPQQSAAVVNSTNSDNNTVTSTSRRSLWRR
jgi:S1-C subfamily serine protease